MNLIHGHLFDGKVSNYRKAVLRWQDGAEVEMEVDGELSRWPLDDLFFSSRLGGVDRRIDLPGGAFFQTKDNEGVDRLLRSRGRGDVLHRLESRWRWIVSLLLISLFGVWLFFGYGLPALAQHAAEALPADVLDSVSSDALEMLDAHVFQPTGLEAGQQLEYRRLLSDWAGADQAGLFRLEFRKGGDWIGANAFALPSGTLVVTDELVELAENDEELAAVLAHEMGHVVHRHGLRQLLQGSVVTVLAVVILGDASSLAAIMPATLLELGYSRRFEREADDYTLEVLARRGVPAERFADILARLEQEHRTREGHEDAAKGGENWSYYLSTHPPTAERLARFGR